MNHEMFKVIPKKHILRQILKQKSRLLQNYDNVSGNFKKRMCDYIHVTLHTGKKAVKKTKIPGIFAILLKTAAIVTACMQVQESDNTNAVITSKFYGGFVMPTYSVRRQQI